MAWNYSGIVRAHVCRHASGISTDSTGDVVVD